MKKLSGHTDSSPVENTPFLTEKTKIKHPDEDALEELNLSPLNLELMPTLISKKKDLITTIEQFNSPDLLKLLAYHMRKTLNFLKSTVVVVSCDDLVGDGKDDEEVSKTWGTFLAAHQDKIASDKIEAVVVFHTCDARNDKSRIRRVEMIILDGQKICRLVWTDEESEPEWSDDGAEEGKSVNSRAKIIEKKLILLHQIINGKKEEVKNKAAAPLFMFGNVKTDTKTQEVADV